MPYAWDGDSNKVTWHVPSSNSLHFLVSKPQFSDGPVTFAKWFNLQLLNNQRLVNWRFDCVLVQPSLRHLTWDASPPVGCCYMHWLSSVNRQRVIPSWQSQRIIKFWQCQHTVCMKNAILKLRTGNANLSATCWSVIPVNKSPAR